MDLVISQSQNHWTALLLIFSCGTRVRTKRNVFASLLLSTPWTLFKRQWKGPCLPGSQGLDNLRFVSYTLTRVSGRVLSEVTPMPIPHRSLSVPPPQLHPDPCSARVRVLGGTNKIWRVDGHYQLNEIMSGRKGQLRVNHKATCFMLLPLAHLTNSLVFIFFSLCHVSSANYLPYTINQRHHVKKQRGWALG